MSKKFDNGLPCILYYLGHWKWLSHSQYGHSIHILCHWTYFSLWRNQHHNSSQPFGICQNCYAFLRHIIWKSEGKQYSSGPPLKLLYLVNQDKVCNIHSNWHVPHKPDRVICWWKIWYFSHISPFLFYFAQNNLVSAGYEDNLILLHSKATFVVNYIVLESTQTLKCHVLQTVSNACIGFLCYEEYEEWNCLVFPDVSQWKVVMKNWKMKCHWHITWSEYNYCFTMCYIWLFWLYPAVAPCWCWQWRCSPRPGRSVPGPQGPGRVRWLAGRSGRTLAPAETRQAPLSDGETETRNAAPAPGIKRQ